MAKATTLANANVQAQGDAMVALLANGFLRLYSGVQPANADAAPAGAVLLAELQLGSPAAAATAATGLITFNPPAPALAVATGVASWFRLLKSDGITPMMDGNADVAGNSPNLVLSTVSIVTNAQVSVSTMTHQIQKTTAGL